MVGGQELRSLARFTSAFGCPRNCIADELLCECEIVAATLRPGLVPLVGGRPPAWQMEPGGQRHCVIVWGEPVVGEPPLPDDAAVRVGP